MKILAITAAFALFVVGAVGWVLNVIAVADSVAFSGMLVLRAIGIFIGPLGAVLGYI